MWTRQYMWTVEEAVHADETLQVNEAVHVRMGWILALLFCFMRIDT